MAVRLAVAGLVLGSRAPFGDARSGIYTPGLRDWSRCCVWCPSWWKCGLWEVCMSSDANTDGRNVMGSKSIFYKVPNRRWI